MNQHEPPSPPFVLNEVVEKIRASYYDRALTLNHLRDGVLPNRQATLEILGNIKDVLFPDHRLEKNIRAGETGFLIGGTLEKVHEDLAQQIHFARTYDYAGDGPCPHDPRQADADALIFLSHLPALREELALDVQAAMDGDPAAKSYDEIIFCYPGFEAVATYRIAHELRLLGVPLLPRMMTEEAHSRTGADIHPGAMIGNSFFIDHATGVVIGETTVIGERVKLYQGVTLGGAELSQGRARATRAQHQAPPDNRGRRDHLRRGRRCWAGTR